MYLTVIQQCKDGNCADCPGVENSPAPGAYGAGYCTHQCHRREAEAPTVRWFTDQGGNGTIIT